MNHIVHSSIDAPEHPLMIQAWGDCLLWAVRDPDALAAYRRDTGDTWVPAKSTIEHMVDQATGREKAFVDSFVAWFNVNVWGVNAKGRPLSFGDDLRIPDEPEEPEA